MLVEVSDAVVVGVKVGVVVDENVGVVVKDDVTVEENGSAELDCTVLVGVVVNGSGDVVASVVDTDEVCVEVGVDVVKGSGDDETTRTDSVVESEDVIVEDLVDDAVVVAEVVGVVITQFWKFPSLKACTICCIDCANSGHRAS